MVYCTGNEVTIMYNFCGREVFWDMFPADENHGITIKNHTPVRKNIVLSLDAPWEGEHGGYISLIKDGDMYKLYYRGGGYNDGPEKVDSGYHSVICVAESRDGKVFTKPMILCGNSMTVNFATSALGSLRIIICNKDGIPLSGYDSTSLFGDSIERPVDFEKPLSELYGKEVRLRIEMSECDLWSMNIL